MFAACAVNALVYGYAMSDRLTREDWLDAALAALAQDGYGALKAQTLARRLNVTRGSFYWHFEDLNAFKTALIERWTNQTTEQVIAASEMSGSAEEKLLALLSRTFRSGEAMERAIRSWATVDDQVARLVDGVDARRIGYARGLLHEFGLTEEEAKIRASLLYWAAIGRLMMRDPGAHLPIDEDVRRINRLMLSPQP